MSSLIKIFECKKCNKTLVNHTMKQIDAHMISVHGRQSRHKPIKTTLTSHQWSQKNPKKQKKIDQRVKELEDQINTLKQQNRSLRQKLNEKYPKESKYKKKARDFYKSDDWRELRMKALIKYGRRCMCCGAIEAIFHVDHIKPRSKNPSLQLDINNLQVLCEACNLGKSNTDETDWRDK